MVYLISQAVLILTKSYLEQTVRHTGNTKLHRGVLASLLIGARLIAAFPQQYQIPFWTRARIERLRNQNLQKTLQFAYAFIPFYRNLINDAGVNVDSIKTPEDLRYLPIVTGNDVARAPLGFIPKRVDPQRYCLLKSSGTTNIKKNIYHDRESLLMNIAFSSDSS